MFGDFIPLFSSYRRYSQNVSMYTGQLNYLHKVKDKLEQVSQLYRVWSIIAITHSRKATKRSAIVGGKTWTSVVSPLWIRPSLAGNMIPLEFLVCVCVSDFIAMWHQSMHSSHPTAHHTITPHLTSLLLTFIQLVRWDLFLFTPTHKGC